MYALDIFDIGPKIRGMIDFVLEHNPAYFVADEIRGLKGVVALVEEVVL